MTECDGCGKPLKRSEALKVYCGSGCYDYFCDETCSQKFEDRSETYLYKD